MQQPKPKLISIPLKGDLKVEIEMWASECARCGSSAGILTRTIGSNDPWMHIPCSRATEEHVLEEDFPDDD